MIRRLAITPPHGAIDPGIVDVWRGAGGIESGFAVLLRDPERGPRELMRGRLAPLVHHLRRDAIPIVLSTAAEQIDPTAEVVRGEGLAGMQLRGDPSPELLERARARLPSALLGRSCHGEPQAGDAHVDYTCFASVFAPRTASTFDKPAAGLAALSAWTSDPGRWVVALGGLTPARAARCIGAGAKGIAGISLFFGPPHRVRQDVASLIAMANEGARDVPVSP